MFTKVGQKISRLGDVIQQPRLLTVYLRGVNVRMYESLNKHWLLHSGIKTVFDVGANTGQFARVIHELLPEAFIYSFEPLHDCFRELQKNMRGVKTFQAFNTALDEKEGESKIYRNEWSQSSSLRRMMQLHKDCFPHTERESEETIRTRKLDDYCEELNIQDNILVKIDVQGFEDKVIAGGKRLMERAKILIVETCMEPLYEGQPLFRDLFTMLNSQGFKYKGALSQMMNPIDESVLYADAIFMRDVFT